MTDTRAYRLASAGFWLPMGRANFFNPLVDKELLSDYNGTQPARVEPLTGYDLTKIPSLQGKNSHQRLQTTAFSRLCVVLDHDLQHPQSDTTTLAASRRYDHVIPIFPAARAGLDDSDPIGVLFTCIDFSQGREWQSVRAAMKKLALFVTAEGFYLWMALYQGADEQIITNALKEHIRLLVGGDFFSHFSGRAQTRELASDLEKKSTLKSYSDDELGILTFLQLNTLLEGMFNYNFDPRVFFDSGTRANNPGQIDEIDRVKQRYAVGNFVSEITTTTAFEMVNILNGVPQRSSDSPTVPRASFNLSPPISRQGDPPSLVIENLLTVFDLEHAPTGKEWIGLLSWIGRNCLSKAIRRDLLRQFMRKTAVLTLQLQKWRIESCRRALLTTMVQVTNRRQPLVQAEIPDSNSLSHLEEHQIPIGLEQASFMITGVNESQLRDYITLIAAKQPLLKNVWFYLEEALDSLGQPSIPLLPESRNAETREESPRETLMTFEHNWHTQLDAIGENIKGLESAIEQVYMSQMLNETEKLRAEEETLAEIERIRDRTGTSLNQFDGNVISIFANLIAFIGLLFAIVLAAPQLSGFVSFIFNFVKSSVVTMLLALVGVVVFVCFFISAYFVLHRILEGVIRTARRLFGVRRNKDERFYYEMDMRLDADMSEDVALNLLAGDFSVYADKSTQASENKRQSKSLPLRVEERSRRKPERSSYRIDRSNADEALHKVYVDAFVFWPRNGWRSALPVFFAKRRMRLFLVYEILFHRPSGDHSYVLKDLRVVTTSDKGLQPEDITDLKELIRVYFVNRWIAQPEQRLQVSPDRFDALLSLNRKHETLPGKKVAGGRGRVMSRPRQ